MAMNKLDENLFVIGRHLDLCENSAITLLREIFPDDTTETYILEQYERVYNLKSSGTTAERRNRIISAMRARGYLTKQYFEDIGNALGSGDYTVSISEGSDAIGFIIHTYSPNTSPQGPATLLPGELYNGPFIDSPYKITVTVTGAASADELEAMYERLKPAWTDWTYTYVP